MKKSASKSFLAVLLVLAAACMWASVGIFVRHLDDLGFTSNQMTAIKGLQTAGLTFLLIWQKDLSLLKIHRKDIPLFLISGICSIFVFSNAYSISVTLLPLSTAVVFLYTAPIFVMIFSVIVFKEKFTLRKSLCLLLSISGIILVSGLTGNLLVLPVKGLLVGLVSGLGYALYTIMTGIILKKGYHPYTNMFYAFLIAGIAACLTCDIGTACRLTFSSASSAFWMFANGLITSFLSYGCYTIALRFLQPSKASIIASVEPVFATLIGVIIFHETLGLSGFAGILLVLCALILSNLPEKAT